MEKYITLGLNIAILVFVLWGAIVGFSRGIRKTAARGIFLIITTILLLIVTPLLTKALLSIKFNVLIEQKETTLEGSYNLKEILAFFIEGLLGDDFIKSYPTFTEFIISIPLLLLNVVLYVILFWLCKYLLLPINHLFYKISFAPRKKKESLGFSSFNNEEAEISKSEDTTQENSAGMFIVKDPEFNKHKKLTEEVNELTIKADKKEKKRLKKEAKLEIKKINKHRLWGAFVGGFCGIIVMVNTCIPIYGIIDMANKAKDVEIENLTEEELSISKLTNGLSDEILEGYNNSVFDKISTYSGIKGLALASFDSLTTTKHNDTKITLREDVTTVITTVEKVDTIIGKYKTLKDTENITKEDITTLLSDTKSLIKEVEKIKLVDVLEDYAIPVIGNYLLKNEIEFSDNAIINRLIAEMIVELLESENINFFDELESLIDVAEYLNDNNLMTSIIKGKFDKPLTTIKSLDNNFANELTDRIYKLKLVDVVLPNVMNISFTLLDNAIDFGYKENDATSEQLKTALTTFLDKTISLAKTLDDSSEIYLTTSSLLPLGDFVDAIKNSKIINAETYSNVLSFAQNKLSKIMNEIMPEEMHKAVNNELLGNLHKVDSWKSEMMILNQALTLLRHKDDGFIGHAVEGKNLREGFDINLNLSDDLLINLGNALDILETSRLFGSPATRLLNIDGSNKEYTLSTITFIMADLMEYISNDAIGEDFSELNEFITKIEHNLIKSNHIYDSDFKFWKNEFTQISPLVIDLSSIINSDTFEITSSFGKALDKAKHSTMLGSGACLILIENTLNIVKDSILSDNYEYNDGTDLANPQTLDDKIYEIFDGITNELNTNFIKTSEQNIDNFWEVEIDKYISLVDIADKATNFSDINDAVEIGADLDNAFDSYTIPQLALSRTFAFAMRDLKTTGLSDNDYIQKQINDTIDSIADKLEDEDFILNINEDNFWAVELEHISRIINIDFDDNLIDNLTSIGVTLDEATNGYIVTTEDDPETTENEFKETYIRPSKLITHTDLRLLLASAIAECQSTLTNAFTGSTLNAVTTALNSIKTNMADTTNIPTISFEFELGHLQTLSTLEISNAFFQKSESESENEENRAGLETLGTSLDSIAYNVGVLQVTDGSDVVNVIIYNDDNNSKIITRPIINNLIINIIDNAKVSSTSTNDQAYNQIIEDIQTKMTDYSTGDYVFSWMRELGFINRLTQLEFKEELTFGNIADNIGSVLDGIAFNVIPSDATIFEDIYYAQLNYKGKNIYSIYHLPGGIFYDQENDTTFGNSLFITRTSLLNAVSSMIDILKEEDLDTSYAYNKEDILNELLDNTTTKVATTNENLEDNNHYSNISSSFTDLTSIKEYIDSSLDIGNKKLTDGGLDCAEIDALLQTIQSKLISGNITTRKMAIYVLDCIKNSMGGEKLTIGETSYDFTDHPAGKYLNTLRNYYISRATENSAEDYQKQNPTGSETNHPNPFASLKDRVDHPENYLDEINP